MNLQRRPPQDLEGLRQVLERTVAWPSEYTFKFIVRRDDAMRLAALLDGLLFTERSSRTGKFVAVTVRARMESADAVIAVYQRVAAIEGLLAF
jgi:hypothetical protein